ncbi:MAG: hypothetical protein AB9866_23965 [Syntrophobacteraceae bacterium]
MNHLPRVSHPGAPPLAALSRRFRASNGPLWLLHVRWSSLEFRFPGHELTPASVRANLNLALVGLSPQMISGNGMSRQPKDEIISLKNMTLIPHAYMTGNLKGHFRIQHLMLTLCTQLTFFIYIYISGCRFPFAEAKMWINSYNKSSGSGILMFAAIHSKLNHILKTEIPLFRLGAMH